MTLAQYKKVIEKISANETVTISAQELLNKKGASYPTGEKIKSINFYDAKSADKLLCSWKYTPVYSNPAGYTFSDKTVRIQFYKYFNDGKTFKVSYRTASGSWYDSDSGHYLYDGTYSMENGTIIMKCGDTIWEGLLEDDDLTLKLNGKYPENATAGIMLPVVRAGFYPDSIPFDTLNIIYKILRGIGRNSFPIFCFLLVEGFIHTKSRLRYALSLLIFGFISSIFGFITPFFTFASCLHYSL